MLKQLLNILLVGGKGVVVAPMSCGVRSIQTP